MGTWDTFVASAIDGEPDDPFVHLLRERIAGGATVVSVELTDDGDKHVYRVTLERLRELSVLALPHSASFTRWSLGAGARMKSQENEANRFAILADERLGILTESVLVERLKAHGPPRTVAVLASHVTSKRTLGLAEALAIPSVDAALSSLASDLGVALRYSSPEVAAILDVALEQHIRGRFHLDHASPWRSASTGT